MKTFGLLENLIGATNERHKVLASNIANADTPHYKARDIEFKKLFKHEVMDLDTTHNKHIRSVYDKQELKDMIQVESNPFWHDLNNVEIDKEVAKITENSILYQTAVKLISSKIRMFKEAVRGRQ